MVTNLNNYGKQIRFMLSTDDPTEVEWHNGDLVFLMDLDKLYVFDADNSTFKEISMGGGGGGGGIAGLSLIERVVLSEAVRSIVINIPSGYDWVYLLINGELAAEDWLYYGYNGDVTRYGPKTTIINQGISVAPGYDHLCALEPSSSANHLVYRLYSFATNTPLEQIALAGYSKDIKAGSKILVFGGKYADI